MPGRVNTPCRAFRCPNFGDPYCDAHKAAYDRRRGSANSRGYGAEWKKLREQVLREEPLCRICRRADSREVDHIIPKPVGTDERWNLQGLCKPCHSRKTKQEDGRWDAATAVKVAVIAGPPGAGKKALLAKLWRAEDLIVDLDRIFMALTGLPEYEKPAGLLPYAMEARDAVINRLAQRQAGGRAWIVAGLPRPEERDRMERRLRAKVLVLETPAAECIRRIGEDQSRAQRSELWAQLVADWWSLYRRRAAGDTIIEPRQEIAA